VRQTFRDQRRPDILSACSQDSARTPVVAAHRSFGSGAAGARRPLKIEATSSDELTKPERRPIAEFTFAAAARLVSP
jgi:hypothetical protein